MANGDVKRIPGKYVKVGEEERQCCEVCGGMACSWRYKDSALNDENGRPKPVWNEKVYENGTVSKWTTYPEAPTESYYNCHPQAKSKTVMIPIERWQKGSTEVQCCGELVSCHNFTNTCHNCGADFNMSGQQLAPREQWGEETGETASDILIGGDVWGGD